ncbi:hypothetical protein LY76DRAFT_399134 [Colletotrichum caudatum]|nr:hypothetical protein LY76DRAFT_399134 [Colletotrichum caudatum]
MHHAWSARCVPHPRAGCDVRTIRCPVAWVISRPVLLPPTSARTCQDAHFDLYRSLSNIDHGAFRASCLTGARYLPSETHPLLRPIACPVRPYSRPTGTRAVLHTLWPASQSPCPRAHLISPPLSFWIATPRCAAWVLTCQSGGPFALVDPSG